MIDPILVKNIGGEALERGEAGVKVRDDDFGLVTSKTDEETF